MPLAQGRRSIERRKLRASHTKSRAGCYTCKSRRVKCDEARPLCGACLLRSEECIYPTDPITGQRKAPSNIFKDGFTHRSSGAADSPYQHISQDSSNPSRVSQSPRALQFDLHSSLGPTSASEGEKGSLHMADLQLLAHFMIHTSKNMSLNPTKRLLWETVIPDLATKYGFVMHLLLALAGLDYFYPASSAIQPSHQYQLSSDTHINPPFRYLSDELSSPGQSSTAGGQDVDTIHLQNIIEHHQRGLQGLRDELSVLSTSNCNQVFAGSMLLVGFAFASLRARNMNDMRAFPASPSSGTQPTKPRLDWIYLIHGLTTVVKEHWPALRMGPLRGLLHFIYGNQDWQMYPREIFIAVSPHQTQHCTQRILKFCLGAYEACASLKSFVDSQSDSTNAREMDQDTPCSFTEQSMLLDPRQVVLEQKVAINILEEMYMRTLYVLLFSGDGTRTSLDVQADLEEAAVMAWPETLSRKFLATLEGFGDLSGLSYIILAHLYLIFSLFERFWYIEGGFDQDIMKINTLINDIGNSRLILLMRWPVSVLAK